MWKRAAFCGCALLAVCFMTFAVIDLDEAVKAASAELNKRPVIILDAGHGGFDGGAVASDGTVEKDINLSITLKLCDFLSLSGYEVILTRDSDIATNDIGNQIRSKKASDLKNRLALMQKYPEAIFVSIHLNKFTTSSVMGAQVFYSPRTEEESKRLGENIQQSIVSMLQPDNKRVIKQGTESTYLLYHAPIPAVIVECGFLSNQKELSLLKTEDYQSRMAFSIFCGILDYNQDGDEALGQ